MTRSHVSHAALLRRIDPGINRVLLCVTLDLSPPLREAPDCVRGLKNRDQPHEYHQPTPPPPGIRASVHYKPQPYTPPHR